MFGLMNFSDKFIAQATTTTTILAERIVNSDYLS